MIQLEDRQTDKSHWRKLQSITLLLWLTNEKVASRAVFAAKNFSFIFLNKALKHTGARLFYLLIYTSLIFHKGRPFPSVLQSLLYVRKAIRSQITLTSWILNHFFQKWQVVTGQVRGRAACARGSGGGRGWGTSCPSGGHRGESGTTWVTSWAIKWKHNHTEYSVWPEASERLVCIIHYRCQTDYSCWPLKWSSWISLFGP